MAKVKAPERLLSTKRSCFIPRAVGYRPMGGNVGRTLDRAPNTLDAA